MKFFILSIFFILISSSVSYAEPLPDFNDIVIGSDGIEKCYIINAVNYHSDDNSIKSYNLIVSHDNNKPVIITSYGFDVYRQDSEFTNRTFSVYECKYGDNSWTHVSSSSGFCPIGIPDDMYVDSMQYDYTILYSNYDLTYNGSMVFQAPHLSLAQAVQMIPKTIQMGVLKQVFYLLPCLIILVIGLISLRKAWNWLRVQLST